VNASSESQFVRRVLIVVGIVITLVLMVLFVWFSVKVWLTVFAGVLFAVFLRGLTNLVSFRGRIASGWALGIVVVLLLGLFALLGVLLVPNASMQFGELSDRLPKALEQLKPRLETLPWFGYLVDKLPSVQTLGADSGKLLGRLSGFFSGGFEAVTGFVLILFLGIYLASAPALYVEGCLRLFPLGKRDRVREILFEIASTLRHWLLGQLLSMIAVGVMIGVGLALLGIPLPLALGVLAGFFDFVPIIGPLFSAVPAVLLAFLISPWHALYTVSLFVLVNTVIESHLVVPLIQRYTVALPPALTMVALVVMGSLFGFLGVLLAIPLSATLLVVVRMAYVEDMLGEE
jgi:predicted PurR-regulated permease PerM